MPASHTCMRRRIMRPMKIFARPTKAFFAYEERLSRQPVTWPPTTHALPDLWYRVRELFRMTLDTIGSALRLAWKQTLTRTERSELLIRLVPVEKTVRMLLMVEAFTFLLMTPEGRKIRREAKPIAIPEPPPPPCKPKVMTEREIFLARLKAELLAPPLEERLAAMPPAVDAHADANTDEDPFGDPLTRAPFRVLGWQFDKPPPREIPPRRRVWAMLLDDAPPLPEPLKPYKAPLQADPDAFDTGPGLSIARRIAALIRVLDNPWPTIRRLARQIASFPRDCLAEPQVNRFRAAEWWHGRPEYYNATSHAACAWRAFMRTEAKLEPG